ncbi:tubulin polyglutamylase [Thraustotheca clavata]|uniref:Tubulin polyglutamylase n=1 Tax=Thraustotheca clavata TaxID=74557 RepID=A0A1W0A375_9STRA|nr:tubulin polyglutamylase [Thraustotheca clavata]
MSSGTKKGKKMKTIKVNMTLAKYEVIKKIAKDRGWKMITDETDKAAIAQCNLHWIDVPDFLNTFKHMHPFQKVNHFPGMSNLARKSKLARNFQRMTKLFPDQYDFCPKTWILPFDYTDFSQQFNQDGVSNRAFIIKPDHSCQGRGVFLTKNLKEVNKTDIFVAQRYILSPLLIAQKKFDLRIYVLISSISPLRVYLFQDGLVRMCTANYTAPNSENMEQKFMHLTNYAINKLSNNFEKNKDQAEDGEGSKRSLRWFFSWLEEKYPKDSVDELWHNIGDICLKSIIAVQPTIAQEYQSTFAKFSKPLAEDCNVNANSNSFALLGMDVLVDENLKPWLLEVNHLPSFHCDSPLDWNIKERLLNQTLDLMQLSVEDKVQYDLNQSKHIQRRLYGDKSDDNQDENTSEAGPETVANTAESPRQLRRDDLKKALTAFYTDMNPEKCKDIPLIIQKFFNNQDELHTSLVAKYTKGIFDYAPKWDGEELIDFVRLYPPPIVTQKNCIYKKMLDACQSSIQDQLLRLTAPLHRKGDDGKLPPLKGGVKKELGRDCFGYTGTDKIRELELKEKKPLAMPGPAQVAAAARLMMGHSSKNLDVAIPSRPTSQNTLPPPRRDGVQYGLAYRERLEGLKNKPTIAMTQITFGGFS